MTILGIGVDIIQNRRIKNSIKKKEFIKRVFGKKEILQSKKIKNKTNYFAKRFAAKEAFTKALGTGFRNGINFKDIQIINNKIGKPYYLLNKKNIGYIKKKMKIKEFDLHLSISDEKEYSIAFTLIKKNK